jgi:hypothetical protein
VKESKGHGNTYALVKLQDAGTPTRPSDAEKTDSEKDDELDRMVKKLLRR